MNQEKARELEKLAAMGGNENRTTVDCNSSVSVTLSFTVSISVSVSATGGITWSETLTWDRHSKVSEKEQIEFTPIDVVKPIDAKPIKP